MAIVLEPMLFSPVRGQRQNYVDPTPAGIARIYHLDGLSASRASARGAWPLITRE